MSALLPPSRDRVCSRSNVGNLPDESDHLLSGDLAVAVLIELGEALVEFLLSEGARVGLLKSLNHEGSCLLLLKSAAVVLVVGLPNGVDGLSNDLFNGSLFVTHLVFANFVFSNY